MIGTLKDERRPVRARSGRRGRIGFALATAIGLATASAGAGTLRLAGFDDGMAGWRSSLGGDVGWADGEDGGHLRFVDSSHRATFVEAPGEWLGDWRGLDGHGSLEFRHRVLVASDVEGHRPYEVVLESASGRAVWRSDLDTTPGGEWTDLSVPIAESAWQVEEGSWDTILAGLTRLAIRIEVVDNGGDAVDVEAIDSIRLVSGVVPGASGLVLVGACAGAARRRRL